MIQRPSSFYPGLVNGQFILPARNESYRIVSIIVTLGIAIANNSKLLTMNINDGASHTLQNFNSYGCPNGETYTIQFIAGAWDAGTAIAQGKGIITVASSQIVLIPDDCWIQPQWTVMLQPSASLQAGDTCSDISVVLDSYHSAKKQVAPRQIEPQDAPP